ncbi:MAG TPA: peptide chain release factor N(5)-glutamine methyltransferase [bacterium]|nr:peptide chain release factor N(5)-glutamine methyltransferase [bacterium]HPT29641.1 peptide chain release factor N(5)-glutamine methyltransferase [bacterium]
MKLGQLLLFAYQKLNKSNIKNYQLDAQYLLAKVINQDRSFVITHEEKELTKLQTKKYRALIAQRAKHYPLAYILGEQEFFGLKFKVDSRVLIPRPETEMIVEKIIAAAQHSQTKTALIDVGCGSGAIIIAAAKNITAPNIKYYGLDISAPALTVAKKNARLNQVADKINFLPSDLLAKLNQELIKYPRLIIAANLPYLTLKQIKSEPSIKHEPRLAQLSGLDGLDHYRRLCQELSLRSNSEIDLIIEIDPSQKKAVEALAKNYWPRAKINITADQNSCPRTVEIIINN